MEYLIKKSNTVYGGLNDFISVDRTYKEKRQNGLLRSAVYHQVLKILGVANLSGIFFASYTGKTDKPGS